MNRLVKSTVSILSPTPRLRRLAALTRSVSWAVNGNEKRCSCPPPDGIIHLHLSKDGDVMINSEHVESKNVSGLLSDIYAVRAERILYLSADSEDRLQNVAEVVDVVQNLRFRDSNPEPTTLRHVRPIRVEVRLVTDGSIDVTCADHSLSVNESGC
jgi:hypothetical protein